MSLQRIDSQLYCYKRSKRQLDDFQGPIEILVSLPIVMYRLECFGTEWFGLRIVDTMNR